MNYTISKEFAFSASHQLPGLPPDHPCGRLHGHNYRVEIVLSSDDLNEVGFVLDYGDLKPFREFIDAKLDHRHLNDVLSGPPTAENLARFLFSVAQDLLEGDLCRVGLVKAIRVSETPKTWAEYRPGGPS